jgi:hypothetical protein
MAIENFRSVNTSCSYVQKLDADNWHGGAGITYIPINGLYGNNCVAPIYMILSTGYLTDRSRVRLHITTPQ